MLAGGIGALILLINLILKSSVIYPYVFLVCGSAVIFALIEIIKKVKAVNEIWKIFVCYAGIAFNIARYHHERYDGKGYPDDFKGTDIPLEARIMALADVYDALVSKRVYKDAFPKENAIQIIEEGSGTQFDPDLVQIFLDCIK